MARICFASEQNKGMDSMVCYRLGHCPYFVIADVDEKGNVSNVESVSNPFVYGYDFRRILDFMKSKRVDVVITGGMSPKMQLYFADHGIKPATGAYGRVKDVLEEYLHNGVPYSYVVGMGGIRRYGFPVFRTLWRPVAHRDWRMGWKFRFWRRGYGSYRGRFSGKWVDRHWQEYDYFNGR